MAAVRWPATEAAVAASAVLVQQVWLAVADAMPGSQALRQAYSAGLTQDGSVTHPWQGDALSARVANLSRHATSVEYGTPQYHLPSVINWAQAAAKGTARRTKDGRWYLIVPFEQAPPRRAQSASAVIPRRAARVARRLTRGAYLTAGASHGRAVHAPGLTPYVPRFSLNVRPEGPSASLQEGLRRISSRGRRSTYMTFRTMTSTSPHWWIPAKPGLHIREQVVRLATPTVVQAVEGAIRQDIAALIRAQLPSGGGP